MSLPIFLIGSPGGHLDLLHALEPAFGDRERIWVTLDGPRTERLRERGERVITLPPYRRSLCSYLTNAAAAHAVVRREQPRLVLTTGAGMTIPFCALARARGGRIVFAETMARVTGPSASGRVLARLASDVLVQWPEMSSVYAGARVCQPQLLGGLMPDLPTSTGKEGTFVAVGTHAAPFDRMLRLVDEAASRGILPRPITVQTGACSYRMRRGREVAWLPPESLAKKIEISEIVICHGGSGIISTALRARRRPIVIARQASHGEHFDDHQDQLVSKLASMGLAVAATEKIDVAQVECARRDATHATTRGPYPELVDELQALLAYP